MSCSKNKLKFNFYITKYGINVTYDGSKNDFKRLFKKNEDDLGPLYDLIEDQMFESLKNLSWYGEDASIPLYIDENCVKYGYDNSNEHDWILELMEIKQSLIPIYKGNYKK
jgi:hypothetical protein